MSDFLVSGVGTGSPGGCSTPSTEAAGTMAFTGLTMASVNAPIPGLNINPNALPTTATRSFIG